MSPGRWPTNAAAANESPALPAASPRARAAPWRLRVAVGILPAFPTLGRRLASKRSGTGPTTRRFV